MYLSSSKVLLGIVVLLFSVEIASSIHCYQCSGTESVHPFQCNEYLDDTDMEPQDCSAVYGAQYCIKHVGRFEASGLLCYQCTSNSTINCGDGMIQMGGIQPTSCDHVFEATYCIKMTGGIGTKRYCSPLDLGNYCDYVKQPGDRLEYRSCVYTCTGDGCNSSSSLKPFSFLLFSLFIVCYMTRSFFVR